MFFLLLNDGGLLGSVAVPLGVEGVPAGFL